MNNWGRHREVEKVKPRQVPIAALPERQQAAALDSAEAASARYPSIDLSTGYGVHVCYLHGSGWEVWLNTEVADFDGICLSAGETREAAIADARKVLAEVAAALVKAEAL
jgi:hypothetical protein